MKLFRQNHQSLRSVAETSLIIVPNWVDLLSLLGLCLNLYAIALILQSEFDAALSLLLLGMAIDFADGAMARKYDLCRDFGRYLDGSIDVVLYLLAPSIFLYQNGMTSPIQLIGIAALNISGIIRLSVFNEIGTVKTSSGTSGYLGMPVYWSIFALTVYHLSNSVISSDYLNLAMIPCLLIMSTLMLYRATFWKIQNWRIACIIILCMSAISALKSFIN
jgi:CDP-diacylglycerol--serine O-phosphatidyltransferase